MPSLAERGLTTVAVRREIPVRGGWARDRQCRVLAGCYETVGPPAREVYVREQVADIEGWSYCEWDGTTPLAVKLYMSVRVCR
jgi:hypothetical protein